MNTAIYDTVLPGQLRGEKVELTAQVRKQQARLQHLERTVTELGKQVRRSHSIVSALLNFYQIVKKNIFQFVSMSFSKVTIE